MEKKTLTREIVEANGWEKLEVITADMLQGYTEIGINAFLYCQLHKIELPETMTSISYNAFAYTPLVEITIPKNVERIAYGAFYNCSVLKNVMFQGDKLKALSGSVFAYCYSLVSFSVPEGVILIEDDAFSNCIQLKELKLPSSLKMIRYDSISGCISLRSFQLPPTLFELVGHPGFRNRFVVFDNKFCIQDYNKPIVAYKGFNNDMTCMNGFQYEEGGAYEFEGEPKLCECGFHACLNPLDVFNYYPLYEGNVYHEVILEGVSEERLADSKVVANKITIGRELTKEEMIEIFNKKVNLEKENNHNN